MIRLMALKTYSDEFRRQAVDLYLSTPGATFKDIAAPDPYAPRPPAPA